MIGWAGVLPFKLQEVTRYHLNAPLGLACAFTFMNKAAYERLPAKAKKAIDEYSGEAFSRRMGMATGAEDTDGQAVVGKMSGHTIYHLSARESAVWQKRVAPVEAEWIKRTPGGARVLAAYKAELAKLDKN